MKRIFGLCLSLLTLSFSLSAADTSKLSPEELEIYNRGEMPNGRLIGAGFAGIFAGFGIGHAIVDHYGDIGWILTAGEVASIGLIGASAAMAYDSDKEKYDFDISSGTTMGIGIAAIIGFRAFEIYDIWTRPWNEQKQYKVIKNTKMGGKAEAPSNQWSFLVLPRSGGGTVSFALHF